jgi:hypothetical protein
MNIYLKLLHTDSRIRENRKELCNAQDEKRIKELVKDLEADYKLKDQYEKTIVAMRGTK